MKTATISLTLLISGLLLARSQSAHKEIATVAYESHGLLYIATASGHTLKVLKSVPSIGTFSISADATKVLFASLSKKPDVYGGQLYLLTPPKSSALRLTHGPYYEKSARSDEVYSDPDLAPNGEEAVFAVHSQSSGDLMEAAGPFATMDLKTGKVKLLSSTLHVPGESWGVGFASSAYWSPDGKRILLNFEDGSALTDLDGNNLEVLSPLMKGGDWTNSLGWLGSQCLVYVAGKDYIEARKLPARFLNLRTRESGPLEVLLGLSTSQVTGLVAIYGKTRIRRLEKEFLVETVGGQWSIPDADNRTSVRLLPGLNDDETPVSCR